MARPRVFIASTGLYTPPFSISNEELVDAYNAYIALAAADHPEKAWSKSDVSFIERASGIKSRFVMDREGILDPTRMRPKNLDRPAGERSVPCEMAVAAAEEAMKKQNITADQIGLVIAACSNMPRAYPSLAVEVQAALGIQGAAFDLNVACASAAFAIQVAAQHLMAQPERAVLIVNPEICSAHLNFKSRDCHFIFGDAATAMILMSEQQRDCAGGFELLGTALKTSFSNNIRNNFGYLNSTSEDLFSPDDLLFHQNGPRVYKDVVHMVSDHLAQQLSTYDLSAANISRLWLHQANLGMNQTIARRLFGGDPSPEALPTILDRYANTSSAGSIIAFHLYHADMKRGDIGLLAAFGAGYSVGSCLLRKV